MAVQTLKFKRGIQADLIAKLVPVAQGGIGVLEAGEPAYEVDTGQVKVGDGINSYADLPYVGDTGTGDPRFVIHDPEANQVLLYDPETEKWINKDLADAESIIYLNARGLTIKGYDTATQGQMLVKDTSAGLAWVKPLSDEQLQQAVVRAEQHASTAGNYATLAGNSAASASTAAGTAQRINQQTMQWVNNKFWWGDIEEYNALESINPGTFYFISAEK